MNRILSIKLTHIQLPNLEAHGGTTSDSSVFEKSVGARVFWLSSCFKGSDPHVNIPFGTTQKLMLNQRTFHLSYYLLQ